MNRGDEFRAYTNPGAGRAGDAMRTPDHRGPDRIIASTFKTDGGRRIEFTDGSYIDARTAVMRCWSWAPRAETPAEKVLDRWARGEAIGELIAEIRKEPEADHLMTEVARMIVARMDTSEALDRLIGDRPPIEHHHTLSGQA